MSMTLDNFTLKAQETIQKAQEIAAGSEHQAVDTLHLLKGLIETDAHVTQFLFQKMGVNTPGLAGPDQRKPKPAGPRKGC
jgi:ATP-dependent Clp protease ATP-binding subunit ClpB